MDGPDGFCGYCLTGVIRLHLCGGNEDFSDELVRRYEGRIVDVVLDAEIVAQHEVQAGDELKNPAGGFRELGIGAGEDEAAVAAAGKEFIRKALGKIDRRGGEGETGPIAVGRHLVETGETGDLVSFLNEGLRLWARPQASGAMFGKGPVFSTKT
jgi:hypothetical protein